MITMTTSPRTVYASRVCTFVMHFFNLSVDFYANSEWLVCFPISRAFYLLEFTFVQNFLEHGSFKSFFLRWLIGRNNMWPT